MKREPTGALVCGHCHAHFVQGQLQCPNCEATHPIGMEMCSLCGEPLTLFGRVMIRQGLQSKPHRLEQMRSRAVTIQEHARLSSEIRMAGFEEIDKRRLENEQSAQAAQQQRDRQLFRYLALGIGIFLLVIAAVSLVILL